MGTTEKILACITLIGLLLWQSSLAILPGKAIFLTGTFLLTCYYLLFGFAYYNHIHLNKIFTHNSYVTINAKKIVSGIFTGIAYFVIISGLLFQIMLWPGSVMMGMTAALIAVILLVSMIFKKVSNPDYRKSNFIRSLILSGLLLLLVALPFATKVNIFYYQYPESVKSAFKSYNESLNHEDLNKLTEEIYKFEHSR